MEKATTIAFLSSALVLMLMQCFIALGGGAANYTSSDESSLLAFKSHITYDPNHIFATNWSTNTSFCHWLGVSCRRRGQNRVTSLDLSNMGLKGTIPPQIGNLSFLTYFNISFNHFNGHLPAELGQLHRLKVFELISNDFNGEIPSSIFNVSAIQLINVADNSLSGSLPDYLCSHLPKLRKLWLYYNEFSGDIPSNWGECRELQYLSLEVNKFTGFIPRGIGNLTLLKQLYLGGSNLQGELPLEMGNLRSLEILALEATNLTSSIPSSLFNISSLKELSLVKNQLFGSLPKDICTSDVHGLEFLALGRNQLTGSIPQYIGNCTSLRVLDLSDNKLSGTIPEEFGRSLSNLEDFRLELNSLTGLIPETIFNVSTLTSISLAFCNLEGNLPPTLGLWLPNLQYLNLGVNGLTGTIPHSISNASQLTILVLGTNKFTGLIPHSLGNLRLLDLLSLAENNFSSERELGFITSLTSCRILRTLWIESNPFNTTLPASVGNLSSSLERFGAANCGFTGNIPPEFGNLSSVVYLRLFGNDLSGSIPTTVSGLRNLQSISLSNNRLNGSIPDDLCHLQHLSILSLSSNEISGPVPSCLGNISSLRNLNLISNKLTSNIPQSLWNLKDLLELDLSSNSFSGYIPQEIGNLLVAIRIDLSMNQLQNEIPSTIGGMQSLIYLSLAHNRFEGPIPDSFQKLISLEFLDLSYNNLSGVIPMSLEALSHLEHFNVSFNRLSGEIPSGGPFQNFTNMSFVSNEALCGASRFQVVPCRDGSQPSHTRKVLLFVFVSMAIAAIILVFISTFVLLKRRKKNQILTPSDGLAPITHRRIAYHELVRATNAFDQSNLLGTGSFSSVYKGVLTDGTILAIKVFNLQLEGAFKSFETESESLRNLRHRNLTGVITCCSTPDFKGLVLEYMPNGTLEKWLYSHNYFLDILKRLEIMIDVACALAYLHYGYSTPVVHCDLKPSNVLLDNDMVAHVSDFGIAKFLYGERIAQTQTLATIGYIAPEYGFEGLVSTRCDVYSFGIMLMETFTRRKPTDAMFDGDLRLKHWVDNSMATGVAEIIDANLLSPNEEEYAAKVLCVSAIMELALRCSAEAIEERTNMRDVQAELKKIKLLYLTNCRPFSSERSQTTDGSSTA